MEVNRSAEFIRGMMMGVALTMLVGVGALGAWMISGPVITIPSASLMSPIRAGFTTATQDVLPRLDHHVRRDLPPVIDKSLEPTLQTLQIQFDGITVTLPSKARQQLTERLNHMVDQAVRRYVARHFRPSQVFNRSTTAALVHQMLTRLENRRLPVRIWPGWDVHVTIRLRPH